MRLKIQAVREFQTVQVCTFKTTFRIGGDSSACFLLFVFLFLCCDSSAKYHLLRFKYTTKFSLPKVACTAIVYAEIVVVIDLFFVGVCPTEIYQQRLQGVRNVTQKLCSWERSFRVRSIST